MTEQELIALRLYRQHLTNPAPGEEICPGFKRNSGSVPFQQPPCPGHPGMRRIRVEPGTGEKLDPAGDDSRVSGEGSAPVPP